MGFSLFGTLVNAGAVMICGTVGALIGHGLPARFSDIVMKGLGLCVLAIGISGALAGENTLMMILSVVLGALLGELLNLDRHLRHLGDRLQTALHGRGGSVSEGFVSASLLFCVGAMAVLGPLESGLEGDHTVQLTKALIDGVSALMMASGLGIGVAFSGIFILLYQGGITLLAGWAAPLLQASVTEMSAVGSLLIIGIGLNMLGLTKLKMMNYVPAIFLPILLCAVWP